MNKKTLKALEGSIEKWRKIVAKEGVDDGEGNCPLCRLFIDESLCGECPVAQKTGQECCQESPYSNWIKHQIKRHVVPSDDGWEIECHYCKDLAKKERTFLESLRP